MILSGQSIRARGIITPFAERTVAHGMTYGLGPAGYDVRIDQTQMLIPGSPVFLASTIERFEMPDDLLGEVADKSTWIRRGLTVGNSKIEPGWCGYLTLELFHRGAEPIRLKAGTPIAQIVFHVLDQPAEAPYAGKYQHQPARPVAAILE
jgi:dCTP deaminase